MNQIGNICEFSEQFGLIACYNLPNVRHMSFNLCGKNLKVPHYKLFRKFQLNGSDTWLM